jgi:hypothetical protein
MANIIKKCKKTMDSEEVNEIVEDFKKTFPEHNIKDLTFTKELKNSNEDVISLFSHKKNKNMIFCYNHEDCFWHIIDKVLLSPNSKIVICKDNENDDEDGIVPKLVKNSCNEIEYELYPMEQGSEIEFNYIDMDEDDLEELDSSGDMAMKIKINDELMLKIDYDHEMSYKIYKNKKRVSGFTDEPTTYQLGDGGTTVYLYKKKDLIVHNYGDVSSIVIIKGVFEC